MKFTINLLGCLFLLFVQVFFINEKVGAEENGYRNFYGIAGSGKPSEDIKYARQMGYEYIALNPTSSPEEYHKNPDCTGLKFYLIDPQWYPQILSGHKRNIDISKPVSDEAKEFYNQRMVWKSNDPFPYNLATGYHSTGDSSKFSVMWDFQQQAVIDEVVEQIILLAKSYENQGLSFAFGGYIINEPKLAGEFYRLDEKGINIPVGLSYWTGVNSGLVHDTITHEYATYSEGMAAFYKKLRARLTGEFTNPKWIVQPTALYSESGNDEWIYQIKDRADKDELTPDLLSQGSWLNTNFVDDANNFNSGVNITKDRVGNSQAGEVDEYKNRLFAAKAGVNGAWYNWCGQSGGVGDMSDFKGITEIYPRLKLIRCLPNWDNLNTVPLGDRSWDGSVYKSTKSYANGDIMYSRHPRTGKLFAVFLTLSGAITLNTGELVTSVECANGFFVESGDGSGDVVITGDEIRLKSRKDIGKGYIFTVSAKGDQSTVMVGSESDGTSGSETSDGTVNGRDLSGSAWVEYVSSKVRDGKGISAKAKISQQSGSTQMWQQVAKRTAAQKSLGYLPGEGWQMILYITYAPSDPSIAYFSTDTNQVWRSSDGGTNWTRKGNGFYAFGASSLGVHPTDPNFVLAAGGNFERALQAMDGIYKTTDGGNNWTRVYSAGYYTKSQRGNCFVFTGSTIYAIKSDSGGLISSTNNGNTWSDVSKSGGGVALTGIGAPYDIKLHPADNSILYACTSSGLYRLDISGGIATQTKIGSGLPSAPQRVVFKPGAPYVMYVVLYDHGVYRSSDSGASFNARNSGISTAISSGGKSRNIAISPANPNRLLVALHGLWPSKHVYYSANEGSSWTNTDTMDEKIGTEWVCGGLFQGGWGPDFAGSSDLSPVVAFHPQNELIALTAGWGEMVKKTTNGGVTWKYSNSGYTGAAPAVYSRSHISWDPLNPNRAVFSLLDFGALMTTNNEDTFKSIAVNTYSDTSGAPCIAMRDNIIIKGIGSWFDFSYITDISRDSGVTWTFVYGTEVSGTAEKNALTYNFARFHPQNSNICYVGKFKFTNIQNNNTFVTLTHPIKEIFPGNGNIVYSFSANTVYKSTDAGASWTTPYPPLPSTHYIQSMAVDPTNQNRLYLGCSNYGVYIITDTLAHGGVR
ncbi:MAG: hypothetical protein HS132_06750 [Planctomycetia bacterium]|nr:hypothetical protein [Planctomycetia bacterium]